MKATDRQTDGRAIAYSALSIYAICSHALKNYNAILCTTGDNNNNNNKTNLYSASMSNDFRSAGRTVTVVLYGKS